MKPLSLLSPILFLPFVTARFQNDFSSYPSGSISCLYSSDASSGCNGDTVAIMNACLCANGGNFITNTAKCMAPQNSSDLSATYSVLKVNCQTTSSSISVTSDEFMAAANEAISSASAASSTSTSGSSTATNVIQAAASASASTTGTTSNTTTSSTTTATATSTTSSSSSRLSTTAAVGIGASLGVVSLLAMGSAIFFILRRRQAKKTTTTQTALLPSQHDYPKPPPSSHASWSPTSPMTQVGAWDATQGNSGAWGAPPGYVGEMYAGDVKVGPSTAVEMPAQVVVYELDSTAVDKPLVEMPGSGDMIHPRVLKHQEMRDKALAAARETS